jgi:quercetin dioxygenase-like cupin family protein
MYRTLFSDKFSTSLEASYVLFEWLYCGKRKGSIMSDDSKPKITPKEAVKTHNAPIVRRPEELAHKMARFANESQMVFHPTPVNPTEPNAGILTYGPGGGFPLHKHDFAQMWYVIEGECEYGDRTLTPGDLVYMQDPHFEYEMRTEKGCKILFMQYPGPTTGVAPIYDGRFNQKDKPKLEEQNLEY